MIDLEAVNHRIHELQSMVDDVQKTLTRAETYDEPFTIFLFLDFSLVVHLFALGATAENLELYG